MKVIIAFILGAVAWGNRRRIDRFVSSHMTDEFKDSVLDNITRVEETIKRWETQTKNE